MSWHRQGARAQSSDLHVHPRWQGVAHVDLGYPRWSRRPMTTHRPHAPAGDLIVSLR
jgi:hypothetical protein